MQCAEKTLGPHGAAPSSVYASPRIPMLCQRAGSPVAMCAQALGSCASGYVPRLEPMCLTIYEGRLLDIRGSSPGVWATAGRNVERRKPARPCSLCPPTSARASVSVWSTKPVAWPLATGYSSPQLPQQWRDKGPGPPTTTTTQMTTTTGGRFPWEPCCLNPCELSSRMRD
jgi:hypothetical protein